MKKLKSVSLLFCAIIFNIVFWNEKIALNAVIFDIAIFTSLFLIYPKRNLSVTTKLLLLAHLFCIITMLYQNTDISKIAFVVTLLLSTLFIQYNLRSVMYAIASFGLNFINIPKNIVDSLRESSKLDLKKVRIRKNLKIIIIPIAFVIVFFTIYSISNSVFNDITTKLFENIFNLLSNIFSWFNVDRIMFLIEGILISCILLLKVNENKFSTIDSQKNDNLERIKKLKYLKETIINNSQEFKTLGFVSTKKVNNTIALKDENKIGEISLILLNITLVFLNVIDIIYVWFGINNYNAVNLTTQIHEGTGMLVLSILLAIFVLLFFFRGNLNFYKKNKFLKHLANIWIIQNIILVFSVFIKDYYYITNTGLAFKRIGVIIFLVMVTFGLVTMFIKINNKKSTYFMFRVNGLIAIFVLVICSSINWDLLIANYNISKKDTIPCDVNFLLTLSDDVIPLLEKNNDLIKKNTTLVYRNFSTDIKLNAEEALKLKKEQYINSQKKYSFLSWNFSDVKLKKELVIAKN